jgi:hypothetical protein
LSAEYLQYSRGDVEGAQELWTRSKRAAHEALAQATASSEHPNAGFAWYGAHVALATHAVREGDRQGAVRHMQDAASARPSEAFVLPTILLDLRLVHGLLDAGERDSVAAFLERSAALRWPERERLLRDAADIRAGVMPQAYNAAHDRARR